MIAKGITEAEMTVAGMILLFQKTLAINCQDYFIKLF